MTLINANPLYSQDTIIVEAYLCVCFEDGCHEITCTI